MIVHPFALKKLLSIIYHISCPLAKAPDFKWEDATTVDFNAWTYRRDMTLKDVRPIDDLVHLLIKTVRYDLSSKHFLNFPSSTCTSMVAQNGSWNGLAAKVLQLKVFPQNVGSWKVSISYVCVTLTIYSGNIILKLCRKIYALGIHVARIANAFISQGLLFHFATTKTSNK